MSEKGFIGVRSRSDRPVLKEFLMGDNRGRLVVKEDSM
jgi:hypothetical protein